MHYLNYNLNEFQNQPFVSFKTNSAEDGKPLIGNDRFEGFCVDMIKIVAQKANFSYILQNVSDGNYGSLVNGTWNGMIGEVITEVTEF